MKKGVYLKVKIKFKKEPISFINYSFSQRKEFPGLALETIHSIDVPLFLNSR